ncbi:hypothetical protein K439DRAFT_1657955 [Ramaria rubella]|nr:hypothetical protein K439DRAFT_1657955 [Ramaria rubella]
MKFGSLDLNLKQRQLDPIESLNVESSIDLGSSVLQDMLSYSVKNSLSSWGLPPPDPLLITVYNTPLIRGLTPQALLTFHTYTQPSSLAAFTQEECSATKSGSTTTYRPYDIIPASTTHDFFATQQHIYIHYKIEIPVIWVLSLRPTVEVSHWGSNLNIQDKIHLKNDGAELKGHFSRLTHQFQVFQQHPLFGNWYPANYYSLPSEITASLWDGMSPLEIRLGAPADEAEVTIILPEETIDVKIFGLFLIPLTLRVFPSVVRLGLFARIAHPSYSWNDRRKYVSEPRLIFVDGPACVPVVVPQKEHGAAADSFHR